MSRHNWTNEKLISRLINNRSDRSRWDAIHILRKRPGEELFSTCVELTRSSEPKTKIIGIDILAQLGLQPRPFLSQSLEIYFALLNSETDTKVLTSVLYAVGHNNDDLNEAQIEKLCSFANGNNEIRQSLVFSLLGVDHPKAIAALIQLSADGISDIRNWATFGIGDLSERNNKRIREALWNRVNDKHQETRLEAILGLSKRKDPRVVEIVKRELIRGDLGSLLFQAMREYGNEEYMPLLQQILESIQGDDNINPGWKEDLEECINGLEKHIHAGKR